MASKTQNRTTTSDGMAAPYAQGVSLFPDPPAEMFSEPVGSLGDGHSCLIRGGRRGPSRHVAGRR